MRERDREREREREIEKEREGLKHSATPSFDKEARDKSSSEVARFLRCDYVRHPIRFANLHGA